MINIEFQSTKELYFFLFDIGKSDKEFIELSENLLAQLVAIQEIKEQTFFDNTQKVLWRIDAWKRSAGWYYTTKEVSEKGREQWFLMKEAAKVIARKIGMEYDASFLLVQSLVKKKNKLFFDAAGLVEDKWKGLIE